MYIYGDLPQMGYTTGKPVKMRMRIMNKNKRSGSYTTGVRIWETEFYIPSSCESIQYRYGIKNKQNSDIVWEREPNRFCNMKDLKFFKNGVYDPVHDALGLK
jgi:hypothetical protein